MSRSPSTPKQQQSAIYRRAARLIEGDWKPTESEGYPMEKFSCWAINAAAGKRAYQFGPNDPRPLLVQKYESTFKPEGADWCWADAWGESNDERNDCRVLALCFMAAVTERP